MDLLQVLRCAQAGLKLIPVNGIGPSGECTCGKLSCPSAGKHPALSAWTVRGSSSLDELGRWFGLDGEYESWNIGVVTGRVSGVIVLDVDQKSGGLVTLAQLEAAHGELEAPCVKTGGGGLHFYFKAPENRRIIGTVGIFPGIDLRAEGNFVVCPPSTHASGGKYAWVDDEEELSFPEMPSWLSERIEEAREKPPGEIIIDRIPLFTRDVTLTSLAGTLRRRGIPEEVLFGCLRVINSLCDPPCDDAQLRKVAHSIGQRPAGDPVVGENRGMPSLLLSFSKAKTMEIEPPRWLIEGICLSRGLHILAGASNSYKSWLSISTCLALSSGKNLSDTHRALSGAARTFYVACEGGQQLIRRITMLARGMDVDPGDEFQIMADNPCLGSGDRRAEFYDIVEAMNPQLVVLDPLRSLFGLREDTHEGWQTTMNWLLALARDRAVILVHHNRKAPAGEKDAYDLSSLSGPGLLVSAPDFILLNRKTQDNEFEVMNVKSRDTPIVAKAAFTLTVTPDAFRLVCHDSRPEDKTNPRDAILTALRGGMIIPAGNLPAITKLSERIVTHELYQLAKAGLIVKTSRGVYRADERPELEEKEEAHGIERSVPEET